MERGLERLRLFLLRAVKRLRADKTAKVESEDDEKSGKHCVHEIVVAEEDCGESDTSCCDLANPAVNAVSKLRGSKGGNPRQGDVPRGESSIRIGSAFLDRVPHQVADPEPSELVLITIGEENPWADRREDEID